MEKFTVSPEPAAAAAAGGATTTAATTTSTTSNNNSIEFSDEATIKEIRRQIELTRREKARLELEIFKGDAAHVERVERRKREEEAAKQAAAAAAAAGEPAASNGGAKEDDDDDGMWKPPPHCVPICGDVRTIDFDRLCEAQLAARGRLFDVIAMDPPWQLASANPTRGVALGYSQLGDSLIEQIPVGKLQTDGFIFMWVINAKYKICLLYTSPSPRDRG